MKDFNFIFAWAAIPLTILQIMLWIQGKWDFLGIVLLVLFWYHFVNKFVKKDKKGYLIFNKIRVKVKKNASKRN